MGIFDSRPALRWTVPSAAALALVGGGLTATSLTAQADAGLPPPSAEKLLTDVASAQVAGLSGTVSERADLGLPDLSALTGGAGGASGPGEAGGHRQGGPGIADLLASANGSHTVRVWYGGQQRQRVAVLDQLGETDTVRNGRNVWRWSSDRNTAVHTVLPKRAQHARTQSAAPAQPLTPQAAAKQLLAAVDPSTVVRTSGTDTVAGRAAYDLVLRPRSATSLIGQVRMAIDATEHVPLRVQVFAKGATSPAIDIGYTSVSFGPQKASRFEFTPPAKATVIEQPLPGAKAKAKAGDDARRAHAATTWVGGGWTSVMVTDLNKLGGKHPAGSAGASGPMAAALRSLPKVSGSWGSGRLLHASLFNAVITNDGRVAVGAVTPRALYAALGG
jgi:outer membrane lipoprotein-sorting protein